MQDTDNIQHAWIDPGNAAADTCLVVCDRAVAEDRDLQRLHVEELFEIAVVAVKVLEVETCSVRTVRTVTSLACASGGISKYMWRKGSPS